MRDEKVVKICRIPGKDSITKLRNPTIINSPSPNFDIAGGFVSKKTDPISNAVYIDKKTKPTER